MATKYTIKAIFKNETGESRTLNINDADSNVQKAAIDALGEKYKVLTDDKFSLDSATLVSTTDKDLLID